MLVSFKCTGILPPEEKALWAALSLEHPLLLWAWDGTPRQGTGCGVCGYFCCSVCGNLLLLRCCLFLGRKKPKTQTKHSSLKIPQKKDLMFSHSIFILCLNLYSHL